MYTPLKCVCSQHIQSKSPWYLHHIIVSVFSEKKKMYKYRCYRLYLLYISAILLFSTYPIKLTMFNKHCLFDWASHWTLFIWFTKDERMKQIDNEYSAIIILKKNWLVKDDIPKKAAVLLDVVQITSPPTLKSMGHYQLKPLETPWNPLKPFETPWNPLKPFETPWEPLQPLETP